MADYIYDRMYEGHSFIMDPIALLTEVKQESNIFIHDKGKRPQHKREENMKHRRFTPRLGSRPNSALGHPRLVYHSRKGEGPDFKEINNPMLLTNQYER